MNDSITIVFWGVRGSYPVTSPASAHFGGDTPCVEIRAGSQSIILDAGTGIISLGNALAERAPQNLLLLLSHFHHDHTQGLPFFAPLYQNTTRLQIMARAKSDAALENQLTQIFAPPQFPVNWTDTPAQKITRRLASNARLERVNQGLGELRRAGLIQILPNNHVLAREPETLARLVAR